jgi:hypothetical protein
MRTDGSKNIASTSKQMKYPEDVAITGKTHDGSLRSSDAFVFAGSMVFT